LREHGASGEGERRREELLRTSRELD